LRCDRRVSRCAFRSRSASGVPRPIGLGWRRDLGRPNRTPVLGEAPQGRNLRPYIKRGWGSAGTWGVSEDGAMVTLRSRSSSNRRRLGRMPVLGRRASRAHSMRPYIEHKPGRPRQPVVPLGDLAMMPFDRRIEGSRTSYLAASWPSTSAFNVRAHDCAPGAPRRARLFGLGAPEERRQARPIGLGAPDSAPPDAGAVVEMTRE
jgi:hypothetical protein